MREVHQYYEDQQRTPPIALTFADDTNGLLSATDSATLKADADEWMTVLQAAFSKIGVELNPSSSMYSRQHLDFDALDCGIGVDRKGVKVLGVPVGDTQSEKMPGGPRGWLPRRSPSAVAFGGRNPPSAAAFGGRLRRPGALAFQGFGHSGISPCPDFCNVSVLISTRITSRHAQPAQRPSCMVRKKRICNRPQGAAPCKPR